MELPAKEISDRRRIGKKTPPFLCIHHRGHGDDEGDEREKITGKIPSLPLIEIESVTWFCREGGEGNGGRSRDGGRSEDGPPTLIDRSDRGRGMTAGGHARGFAQPHPPTFQS